MSVSVSNYVPTLGAVSVACESRFALLLDMGFERFVVERALQGNADVDTLRHSPIAHSVHTANSSRPSLPSVTHQHRNAFPDSHSPEHENAQPKLRAVTAPVARHRTLTRSVDDADYEGDDTRPVARQYKPPKRTTTQKLEDDHTSLLKRSKGSAGTAAVVEVPIDVEAETLRMRRERNAETYDMFWRYVHERQMIWFRRQRGDPEPWTQEGTLQTYFFCNVYRELDKGSIYFKEQVNMRRHKAGGSLALSQVVFMAVVYRLINNVSTFERYPGGGIPLSHEIGPFILWLRREMDNRRQVFTGAHQNNGLKRYEKTITTLVETLDSYTQLLARSETLEKCLENLRTLFGMGSFFAWQVACDLLELKALQFKDQEDFALIGPSAQMGLANVFPLEERTPQEVLLNLVSDMAKSQEAEFQRLALDFPKLEGKGLNLKNLEHSLCEFGKYIRIVKGGQTSQKLRKRLTSASIATGSE